MAPIHTRIAVAVAVAIGVGQAAKPSPARRALLRQEEAPPQEEADAATKSELELLADKTKVENELMAGKEKANKTSEDKRAEMAKKADREGVEDVGQGSEGAAKADREGVEDVGQGSEGAAKAVRVDDEDITQAAVGNCKDWCYTHTKPWITKCKFLACPACEECTTKCAEQEPTTCTEAPTVSPTPAPTPPPTPAPTLGSYSQLEMGESGNAKCGNGKMAVAQPAQGETGGFNDVDGEKACRAAGVALEKQWTWPAGSWGNINRGCFMNNEANLEPKTGRVGWNKLITGVNSGVDFGGVCVEVR